MGSALSLIWFDSGQMLDALAGYVLCDQDGNGVANACGGNRYVQTDMGNDSAKLFGMEKAFQELEPTVAGMVKVVSIFRPG